MTDNRRQTMRPPGLVHQRMTGRQVVRNTPKPDGGLGQQWNKRNCYAVDPKRVGDIRARFLCRNG
jgi:hypothetical protein